MQKKIVFILVSGIIILLAFCLYKPLMLNLYKVEYSEYVEKYSEEYGVDKFLVYAIIKNESNFISEAVSIKEAKGLMQLMNSTAEELANKLNIENELYDDEINIQLGVFYLAELLQRYENYLIAVAAYNAGIGNVDNWIKDGIIQSDGSDVENIPYKETNNYVRKVSRDYKNYRHLYE